MSLKLLAQASASGLISPVGGGKAIQARIKDLGRSQLDKGYNPSCFLAFALCFILLSFISKENICEKHNLS